MREDFRQRGIAILAFGAQLYLAAGMVPCPPLEQNVGEDEEGRAKQ